MRYSIKTVNFGPFKQYQVLDNCKKPARVLLTTEDADDAKDFITREVEANQWNAANRD
jgi:hypothetical protein